MKKQGTLIISCLVAAAAGVAIGMLLAPDSGENLRKNVKKSVQDWAGKLSEVMNEGKNGMNKASDFEADEKPVTGGLS